MAKKDKKAKKGDKKKISALDSALDQRLTADREAYQSTNPPSVEYTSTPATQPPADPAKPRPKYEKPVLFPRKVMALFTEGQYRELTALVSDLRKRDGKLHSLNSVIRDAVAQLIKDFRHGK